MKQSIFTRPLLVGVRRRAFAAFAALVAFAALASAAQAQTLHLVTVGNPEGFKQESAKKDVKKDLDNIRDFFIENVPKNRLNLEAVNVSNKTPRGVRAAIRSLNDVKPDDVVVFYYTGHAGNQLDEAGHVFQLFEEGGKKEQRLPRKDVRADLALTQARLIVLLSDCCNAFIQPIPTPKVPVVPAKEVSPVAQKLFFEPSGCVDITSSKLGQYSFTGDGDSGSLATAAWIKVFEEVNETLKDDPKADVDWKTVSGMMIEKTEEMFKKKYPDGTTVQGDFQDAQTPHVYELPGAPRLGAKIQTRQQNLVVTKIVADSPAEKAGMQKGDILVAIRSLDGTMEEIRPVDEAEYADAIDYAPRDVDITVKRQNGKNTLQLILTVELNGLPLKKKEVAPVEVADLGVTLKGQEITEVVADSPADQAGLEVGDKIETCDGAAIETGEDLQQALEAKPESATLVVVKKSDDEKTDVVVNFAAPVSKPFVVADLGVTLKGPEITEVVSGSPAANAGLEVGDKIVAYNGAPIQTGADVQNALDPKQFGAPITVLKKSGGSEPTDLVVPFYRPGKPTFGATVQGQKITNVVPDSPAALAGLQVDDQMIAFNGATIKNALDYEKAVDASPFHAQVVVLKTTTGQQVTVDVYLNRDPNGKPIPVPDVKGPVFGATVKGQELIAVVANSPAANAGLQVGDKILSFNGATINNAIDYEKAVDASPVTANLVVLKKGSAQQTNVSVRLNKTETTPPAPAKVDPPKPEQPAQPAQQELTVDQTPARFGALFNGQAITKIVPGSPADKAGLKVGEKIVILNGETVQTAQAIAAGLGKTPSDNQICRVLGLDGQIRDFKYTINQ